MRIHHLNCGTCCPAGGRLFDGTTDRPTAEIVCHCLLLETDAGLVLVDTGYGLRDAARRARISPIFRALNRPQFREHETAAARVRELGFRVEDVRHIVVTHLDFDHAGGLEDFPWAAVHVTAREREVAAERRGGAMGGARYRPGQWDEVGDWRLYAMGGGEPWRGFDAVRDLEGLPPEILLVPLAGHTWGHAGVAVDTGAGWLLHAGDAYFFRGEMGAEYRCPPGMAGYQRLMEVDRAARLANQAKLRSLVAANPDVRVVCAHDRIEFEMCAGGATR
jgi:glyoxylase-like metal-dependent hydrolase (beta-lactamase superfamily II)